MRKSFLIIFIVLLGTSPGATASQVIFRGLRTVSDGEARTLIKRHLQYIADNGPSTARADDAAYFLANALRKRGLRDAEVAWSLTTGQTITLDIDEGRKFTLGTVTTTGNQALDDSAVRELLTSETRGRDNLPPGAEILYVQRDIEKGVTEIQHFYSMLGYLDATVTLQKNSTPTSGDSIGVMLQIDEGQPYRIGTLRLPAAPAPGIERAYAEARSSLGGKPYTLASGPALGARIRSAAREAGYFQAEIRVGGDPPQDAGDHRVIPLFVTAEWGGNYTLGAVEVSGNEKIKPQFFERLFADLLGKPYTPEAIRKKEGEALETGALQSLASTEEPQPDQTITLKLDVEEAPAKRYEPAIGYGNYEGLITALDFRNSNVSGLVRAVGLGLELSQRGLRGDLNFEDPWFLWSNYGFKGSLFSATRQNEGYDKFETGLRFELGRIFGAENEHELSFFTQVSFTEVTEAEIEASFLGKTSYITPFAGVSYTYNRLDDRHNPRSGFLFGGSLAGAPDLSDNAIGFVRGSLRFAYHQPLGKTTLRLGARAGIVTRPGNDDTLPIDLRFFSGGSRSVRSFPERELGPEDPGGFPVGGEFYSIFNAELDIPVFGGLSIAPFADAGNLLPEAGDAGLDDLDYAAGIGLRYQTPIGPLRVDYGFNLDPGEREPSGSLHITFGLAF